MLRLVKEEGKRKFAYNDRTGMQVSCKNDNPAISGNLSIGIGINLEFGLDDEEISWLTFHRLSLVQAQIDKYDWYQCDGPRQSVFLDIAFNAGVTGLLRFPSMLHYASLKDWDSCAKECAVADPKLNLSRYAPLRQILLTGVLN